MIPPPPRSTLFPYPTLFRSRQLHGHVAVGARAVDAIERLEVDVPGCPRLRGAAHRLAQEIKARRDAGGVRSEEHTSELQSQSNLVCRLLLEKKKNVK